MGNKTNKIFIATTCLVLLFPLFDKIVNISKKFPLTERRALAKKPELTSTPIKEFIEEYENYFNDNYGGRNLFIHAFSNLKYRIFKTSPFPDRVVIGKDDFFFLGNRTHKIEDAHNGKKLLTKKALKRIATRVENNYAWSENNKIGYYLAIAPDKYSIYFDKLPSGFKQNIIPRNLDNLVQELKNKNIPLIESRKRLIALKKQFKLYAKTDSHWNDNGAFFFYQDLIRTIQEAYPEVGHELKRSDFDIIENKSNYNTTTDMINISHLITEKEVKYVIKPGRTYSYLKLENQLEVPPNFKGHKSIFEDRYRSENKNGLKLLVFKDSFCNRLKKFLIPHFEEVVFVENFHNFNKDLIVQEKPDIIIHEIVERGAFDYLLNY